MRVHRRVLVAPHLVHEGEHGGMAAKDELGRAGEERAADYLRECGYRILDRNWRCAEGEIDIVAADGATLAVVEVKTRATVRFGDPLAAVTERKRQRLWRLAGRWRREHPEACPGHAIRIDVIAIVGQDPASGSLDHLRDLR